MPGKAAKVLVSERQLEILTEFQRSQTEPRFVVQRAAIIALAWNGQLNEEIAPQVGLGRMEVGKWRRRWQDAWEELTLLECTEPRRLRQAIRDTLRDAPRSGSPGKFTAEQVTQILAVACEPPPQSGRPITHWTHAELRDEVVKRGIVTSISVWQVGCYLREAAAAAAPPQDVDQYHREKSGDVSAAGREVCQTYQEALRVVMRNTARAHGLYG